MPSAPQGLAATGGNGTVKLSWSAPASNGGAAVTGYDVYRGTSAGGESATPVATNVTGTSFTDTGLVNGTTYYYTVAAVNAAGLSPQSGEASATPRATAPSAPLAVVASGGNSSVTVSWSVPASNGGSAVTGYDVYRGTSAGGESATPVATNVAGTSFTDTGLVNGTTYYYTVAAVNAAGLSPQSNEASATPQARSAAAFVQRVGSVTASASRATTTVPVGAPGVAAGHTLVVSLLMSSTTNRTGAVSATDSAGNSYTVARDTNDGSGGDRTMVLVSVGVKALPAGGSITLTYPVVRRDARQRRRIFRHHGNRHLGGRDRNHRRLLLRRGSGHHPGLGCPHRHDRHRVREGANVGQRMEGAARPVRLLRLPRRRLPDSHRHRRLRRHRHDQRPVDGQHRYPQDQLTPGRATLASRRCRVNG